MNYAEFALIRFGSGLSPDFQGPDTPDALIEALQDDSVRKKFPVISTADVAGMERRFQDTRRVRKESEKNEAAHQQVRKKIMAEALRARRSRMARAVAAPIGLSERLTQFWASHFSIRAPAILSSAALEAFLEDAIRQHQNGRFADLLKAATLHPAMLQYLNQNNSVGPRSQFALRRKRRQLGLNENHARELLELHTLGVGDAYTQKDIRQLAELMTGLSINGDKVFAFNAARAEPGAETVLGKEYGGGRPPKLQEFIAFLDDLAVHPATARFISLKLARHFCADEPEAALVDAMTKRFRETDGDLTQVYHVMVAHDYAKASFGQKVRQPWDLLAAGFRSLGLSGELIMNLPEGKFRNHVIGSLKSMGQPIMGAPQPEGWPEEAATWLSPQLLAARINWGLNTPPAMTKQLPEVSAFLSNALDQTRAAEIEDVVRRAESRPEGIGLVLASPQFNRR